MKACWHSLIIPCKVSSQHNLIKSPQKAQNPALLNQILGARFLFSKKPSSLLQSVMDRKEELLRFLKLLNIKRDHCFVFIKICIHFICNYSLSAKERYSNIYVLIYCPLCYVLNLCFMTI